MLYHSQGAVIFFSNRPRNTTAGAVIISGSTSSVMKGGQGISLLPLLVLTTLIKSPSFPASTLAQFFHIHPPLDIFSHILMFFFTPFPKRKTLHSLSSFFLILAALPALLTHCQLLYLTLQPPNHLLTRCPPGEVLRARLD